MVSESSKFSENTSAREQSSGPQVRIFGEFPEDWSEAQEYLLLKFSPSSLPLKKRWCTNGLSAGFLADYLKAFFPGDKDQPDVITKQEEIQSAVSYIANELLENSMKFNNYSFPQPISIQLQLYPDRLVFLVTNGVEPSTLEKYQSYIQELISSDPSELLIHRIEQNAKSDQLESSKLGLITIMNDYFAKLGWKFETVHNQPDIITVTTLVQIAI